MWEFLKVKDYPWHEWNGSLWDERHTNNPEGREARLRYEMDPKYTRQIKNDPEKENDPVLTPTAAVWFCVECGGEWLWFAGRKQLPGTRVRDSQVGRPNQLDRLFKVSVLKTNLKLIRQCTSMTAWRSSRYSIRERQLPDCMCIRGGFDRPSMKLSRDNRIWPFLVVSFCLN